jgi:uncharacterized protein (DUF302 family)
MLITQLNIERFSLLSARPFEDVLGAVRSGIGCPEMDRLWREIWNADTYQDVEAILAPGLGPTGLMLFAEFDDGRFIRKANGAGTPQSIRLLIGNPLIMKQMTEHVPDAAAYAPVTVLIDERPAGVHLSYDRMASLLAVYGNQEVSRIAKALDKKIETLITSAI